MNNAYFRTARPSISEVYVSIRAKEHKEIYSSKAWIEVLALCLAVGMFSFSLSLLGY